MKPFDVLETGTQTASALSAASIELTKDDEAAYRPKTPGCAYQQPATGALQL